MATKERHIIEQMFMIPNKAGEDVPFILNTAQAQVDQALSGRDIIPKARQEGVSSYFLARFTARCLYMRNRRCVVISHEEKATERMLLRVQYFLENLRGPKPVIKNMSRNEITFPKTGSMFYIGTAGAKKFGRGDTITELHGSEVAFWPDPKSLLAGLFQAVPDTGQVALESTGNGVGNYYHRACTRALEGKGRYRLHFLPWHTFPEYTRRLTSEQEAEIWDNLDPDIEEPELIEQYPELTAGQLAFRREKLEELEYDLQLFKQEYPMTLDECFQATGHSIFHKVPFIQVPQWERVTPNFWKMSDHPRKGLVYAMGADPAGGVGRDHSALEVVDVFNAEQVAEYKSNRIDPVDFADKCADIGRMFGKPEIAVEQNNHGLTTISRLIQIYPTHLIYKDRRNTTQGLNAYGIKTTMLTKPLMVGLLQELFKGGFIIHSTLLQMQLNTFVEKENEKMEAEEGEEDDLVMAMCMVAKIFQRVLREHAWQINPPKPKEEPHPLSMEGILANLVTEKGENLWPISPQHEGALVREDPYLN